MAITKEFSIEERLKLLVELQKIECKLDDIVTMRGELPLQVKDLEDSLEGMKTKKNKIEEEINGIQDFIVSKKEAIKIGENTLKKYEKQSKNVKNNREFESLEKEIKFQSIELKLAERHIINAENELKTKIEELEILKKQISEKQFFLNKRADELIAIVGETEKEEKHYTKLAEEAKKQIDDYLVRSYEKIRKKYKNGMGIVAVIREACGGCFSAIPPQKQSEVKLRKNIIICENCGRILTDEELFNSVKIK